MTTSGPASAIFEDDPKVLRDLAEIRDEAIDEERAHEAYHDAVHHREQAAAAFSLGVIDLPTRARAERLYFECCANVLAVVRELEAVLSEEIRARLLAQGGLA